MHSEGDCDTRNEEEDEMYAWMQSTVCTKEGKKGFAKSE